MWWMKTCNGLHGRQTPRSCRSSRVLFFFSSRRRHTRFDCDWSSDVCSSDLWRLARFVSSNPSIRVLLSSDLGLKFGGLPMYLISWTFPEMCSSPERYLVRP